MTPVRPELVPDDPPEQDEMRAIQRIVRENARFEDEQSIAPENVIIAGIDQAFEEDEAVSAVVVWRDGAILERATARTDLSFPYIPGYLAFREAGPILDALEKVSNEPDLLLIDGNGRIHPREAGLATHVGVVMDIPTVGVAKRLLCGQLVNPPRKPFQAGTVVRIEADSTVAIPDGTLLGYAVQTRQWDDSNRSINPLYVSPGHRIGPETAAEVVLSAVRGYKLPEPIRLADRLAGERTGTG